MVLVLLDRDRLWDRARRNHRNSRFKLLSSLADRRFIVRKLILPLLLAASVSLSVRNADASPLAVFGIWNNFSFTDVGVLARGCYPPDPLGLVCDPPGVSSVLLAEPAWTFAAPTPVVLKITDGYFSGDAFNVYDNGQLIGSTPIVDPGTICANFEDFCFSSPQISHAVFPLPAGAHSIEVRPTVVVDFFDGGFLRVDAVPEPSSLILVLSAACLLRIRWQHRGPRTRQLPPQQRPTVGT